MGTPASPPAAPSEPGRATDVQRTPRRRKRGRGYYRSGFYALKTTLRALGPRVVDRRTHLGRQLAGWKADLVRDLGGEVSTQEVAVIDLAVRTKLLLDSIDAWLLVQPSLLNARKRALIPVVRERQALADALARYLGQLGLARRPRPVPDLREYLAAKASAAAPEPGAKADGGRWSSWTHPSPSRELLRRCSSSPSCRTLCRWMRDWEVRLKQGESYVWVLRLMGIGVCATAAWLALLRS